MSIEDLYEIEYCELFMNESLTAHTEQDLHVVSFPSNYKKKTNHITSYYVCCDIISGTMLVFIETIHMQISLNRHILGV